MASTTPSECSSTSREAVRTRLADLQSPTDLSTTIELLDMYAREPMGAGEPLAAEVLERLRSDLPTLERLLVILAEDASGRAVGLAFCLMGYSTFYARPLINIHDLAVVPEARGQGVGASLLHAVLEQARQRDCCKVTLEVRSDNDGAQRLYRRFGFTGGPRKSAMQFWTRHL